MSKASHVKAYPKEFREKVVQLVQGGDRSQREVAEEFGISTDSVRRWVQQAERDQGSRQDGLRTERARGTEPAAAGEPAAADGSGNPVKGSGLVRSGDQFDPVTVFEFVRANQGRYRIACMCRLLGVSTSGYYGWRVRSPSRRAQQNQELSRRIAAIHAESRQIYGARRVWAELRAQGVTVSRQRVARLMRALGLQGVTRRKRRCTTRRDAQAAVAPDRVQRRFEASEPNRLWVADITYVPTLEGFVYLATVLDVFSRKVVGWAMSARQTVDLVQSALGMAVTARAAQAWYCIPTAVASTRRWCSPGSAPQRASSARWARRATVSTMRWPKAYSPRWNASCCSASSSRPARRRNSRSSVSWKVSTTGNAAIQGSAISRRWNSSRPGTPSRRRPDPEPAKGAATIAPGCCTCRVSRSRLGGQRAGNGNGKTVGSYHCQRPCLARFGTTKATRGRSGRLLRDCGGESEERG